LKIENARDIYAAVAHGVLTRGSAERLEASPIKELIMTDTIEYRFEPLPKMVRIVSAASLFAKAIRNIHAQTSVSELFEV
jgi:ribose-phosphate pyrophosphokinase